MTGCFLSSLLRYDSFQTASNALDKEPLEAPAAGVYRRPGKLMLVHHVRPTDVITTQLRRPTCIHELSPVRLPLALVASLIKLHTGTPENLGLFAVCSP